MVAGDDRVTVKVALSPSSTSTAVGDSAIVVTGMARVMLAVTGVVVVPVLNCAAVSEPGKVAAENDRATVRAAPVGVHADASTVSSLPVMRPSPSVSMKVSSIFSVLSANSSTPVPIWISVSRVPEISTDSPMFPSAGAVTVSSAWSLSLMVTVATERVPTMYRLPTAMRVTEKVSSPSTRVSALTGTVKV